MRFIRSFLHILYKKLHSYVVPSRHNAYRPYLLRKQWLLFFLTVTLTAEAVLVINVLSHESARNYLAAVLPLEVVALTNTERNHNNLPLVTQNQLLTDAAQAKAEDMALLGYFSHSGPDGKEPWAWIREAGYVYASAGENLAVRFNESSNVVRAWMASPGHRANIVKAGYTEIGVGVADGIYQGAPATFVVQYFARPYGTPAPLPPPVVLGPEGDSGAQLLAAVGSQQIGDSLIRSVVRLGTEPSSSALYVLGGVVSVLIMLLGVTFFAQIQIQPVEMLAGGSVVALIALSFLALNMTVMAPTPELTQTASIFNAAGNSVLVGEEGATTLTEEI
ncbi:MAG: hypothetical protein KBD50_01530 [Candidatus Pacebacteria bacterium]|nr:hypothetical protein [Candidatus Paceibacterota bacterium]